MKRFSLVFFLLNSLFISISLNCFNNPFNIEEYVTRQQYAVQELEKILPQIHVTKEVAYIPGYRITTWEYLFSSLKVKKTFRKYWHEHRRLSNKAILVSLYKGLLAGVLAFSGHKFLPGNIVIAATLAGAIGTIPLENNAAGIVPYYDKDLEKHNNYFDTVSVFSLFRTICIVGAASVSYWGANQIEKGIRKANL